MQATCFECGEKATHAHHVVPRILGGTRTISLCGACHSKVHGRNLDHQELIKAGIAKAKASGKRWGGSKPGRMWRRSPETDEQVRSLVASGMSKSQVARHVGLSRPTVYEILNAQAA